MQLLLLLGCELLGLLLKLEGELVGEPAHILILHLLSFDMTLPAILDISQLICQGDNVIKRQNVVIFFGDKGTATQPMKAEGLGPNRRPMVLFWPNACH